MKLTTFSALLLALSTQAHAQFPAAELICEEGEVLGNFRIFSDAYLCPSRFSMTIEGREYCVNEDSNLALLESAMENLQFIDVNACTDWHGNIQKIEKLPQRAY